MDREQHRRPVRILQVADRRRIGRELRNRSADLAVVRNRDRRNVRIVEPVEVRRQIGRRIGDVEPANDLVERRLIGQERGVETSIGPSDAVIEAISPVSATSVDNPA